MKALIIGTGMAGLATALRLLSRGYEVEMVEAFSQPGGRLNQLKKDGFVFDMGPTFFSMSYEFDELAEDSGIKMPFKKMALDPIYTVWYDTPGKKFKIYRDFEKLEKQFEHYEPRFREKMIRYMKSSGRLYSDTEKRIIKRNFNSLSDYIAGLMGVPLRHLPKVARNFWQEVGRYFSSDEVKEILSLVAFFLGGTPFDTPAVYTMLSFTEFVHDGYYNIEGGMYKIVEGLVEEIKKRGGKMSYNVRITGYEPEHDGVGCFVDSRGKAYKADVYIVNADAASFRGKVMNRKKFRDSRLDKMKWTMAPLSIYLGLNRKVPEIDHHNYFLRGNFKDYANKIYKNKINLDQPYYYVNVVSRYNHNAAPEGHEAIYILVPVPDRRFKPDWNDSRTISENIFADLSQRTGFNLNKHIVSKTILTPVEWENMFGLHRGSGLGLAHNLSQIGWFRPSNCDEVFKNLFYTGSSTIPGTGVPIAVISSKLVMEQIDKVYGTL
ncbi:phytoene desaturase family protein [Bacteroidota bacterium]